MIERWAVTDENGNEVAHVEYEDHKFKSSGSAHNYTLSYVCTGDIETARREAVARLHEPVSV